MTTIASSLKQQITSSLLTPNQQFELIAFCALRKTEELENLQLLFAENSVWIKIFYDNYLHKADAFLNNDKAALSDILEEEKQTLESIS